MASDGVDLDAGQTYGDRSIRVGLCLGRRTLPKFFEGLKGVKREWESITSDPPTFSAFFEESSFLGPVVWL